VVTSKGRIRKRLRNEYLMEREIAGESDVPTDDLDVLHRTFNFVSRCPNVRICLQPGAAHHPCHEIVNSQEQEFGVTSYDNFQVPEPWTGEIDRAPILFILSNPSIGKDNEAFGSSSDEEIWDSHYYVFGGGKKQYTKDGKYTTGPTGERNLVPTWAGVRKRAEELIPDREVTPGIDYALTEIVHCKSKSEKTGVTRALPTCTKLHFESIMNVAAARVIVALGKAREHVRSLYKISDSPGIAAEITIGGRPRLVAFLGHPTGPEKRKFSWVYPTDLPRLRKEVALACLSPGSSPVDVF
jgi:hypothetical protein